MAGVKRQDPCTKKGCNGYFRASVFGRDGKPVTLVRCTVCGTEKTEDRDRTLPVGMKALTRTEE